MVRRLAGRHGSAAARDVRGGGVVTGPHADPLARFLLAVARVVLLSHLFGLLVGRLGQAPVIGEIPGELLLGPSAPGTARTTGAATAADAS
ncbi:hypothetical protein [Streptomyces sp. NPDC017673]|uniref:hypothetical protein n=1 Tax=unclassified Streptomyces TaxID=2593676 RepID=UPI003798F0EE